MPALTVGDLWWEMYQKQVREAQVRAMRAIIKQEVDAVNTLGNLDINLDNGMLTDSDRDAVIVGRCALCNEAIYLGDVVLSHSKDFYCYVECLLADLQVTEITVEDYLA